MTPHDNDIQPEQQAHSRDESRDESRDQAQPASERALWSRVERSAAGDCPTLIDLAAYVDGRLEAGDHERVESHLASVCPQCLAAVRLGVALLADDGTVSKPVPASVPASVIIAASALVPGQPDTRHAVRAPGVRSPGTVGRWGLAAAASIGVCLLGYHVGATVGPADAPAATPVATDAMSEMTFGLFDTTDGGLDALERDLFLGEEVTG